MRVTRESGVKRTTRDRLLFVIFTPEVGTPRRIKGRGPQFAIYIYLNARRIKLAREEYLFILYKTIFKVFLCFSHVCLFYLNRSKDLKRNSKIKRTKRNNKHEKKFSINK